MGPAEQRHRPRRLARIVAEQIGDRPLELLGPAANSPDVHQHPAELGADQRARSSPSSRSSASTVRSVPITSPRPW